MKKILLFLMTVIMFTACNGCGSSSQESVMDSTTVDSIVKDSVAVIDVEHAIATDRQTMYMKSGGDYRWFETEILLPEFMDSDSATSNPVMLVNIFQKVIERGNGYDTYVYKFQHFSDGTVLTDSVAGFWVENWPLEDKAIKLKYTEAWDKVMAVNFPKPHSKHVTLRNPIGPVEVNTQWIFGNIHEQIWVDAVTGECTNSNPAFPEAKGFKMPLGEWP
jgi:hypothetical protein